MTQRKTPLLAGRLLVRNIAWNVVGFAAPLLAGLVSIPLLISAIGTERFGLLTLIWVGVGYLSLFDAGLSRALTKLVAEHLGKGQSQELRPLMWTGIWAIAGLGVGAAVVLLLVAAPLAVDVLNVSPELHGEAIIAFRVLGASLPIVLLSSAMIGILEAHQRFPVITAVRIPLGVMTFAAPLLAAQFTPSLWWATASLVTVRFLAFGAYVKAAGSVRPEILDPCLPKRSYLRELLSFGGWLTVTNVVGPLMTYLDRFLIGAIVTMTTVAYYTTPYEVLSQVRLVPQAMMGVLFPAFSTAISSGSERLIPIYQRAVRILISTTTPVLIAAFLFASEALNLWIGPEFSQAGTAVARWLAAGWLVNFLARAPFTVLQGTGRPDLVAKTHLAELLPYLATLWILTTRLGIEGAAIAWFLRVTVDAIVLNEITRRTVPRLARCVRETYMIGIGLLALVAVSGILDTLLVRGLLLALVLSISIAGFVLTLRGLLADEDHPSSSISEPPSDAPA